MSREYTNPPYLGDSNPCPKCGASIDMTRVRGIMTDKQHNDRRCNKCGHLWTVGDTLDLPLGGPEGFVKPTKQETDTQIQPETPPDYDFGDGFEEEIPGIPF